MADERSDGQGKLPKGMAFRPATPVVPIVPPPTWSGLGRLRKVAIIGTADTIKYAPWDDLSWEIWSHASARALCRRVSRYFDLHPRELWEKPKKWDPSYLTWLTRNPVPIYMQQRYPEIPASVAYPKVRILSEFRPYFTSHAAWMMALALTEGVTHLGFFGTHYSSDSEYAAQRSGCEYFMGLAEGRGVQLVVPEGNPLLRMPKELYGFESHPDGKLIAAYRWNPKKPHVDTPNGPIEGTIIDMENPNAPRPPLRQDLSEPPAWERSGHPLPQLKPGGGFKHF